MPLKVEAITFDDFNTLRYQVEEQEDIVYPIFRALKKGGFVLEENEFVKEFFRIHGECERRVKETLRETLLDDIVVSTLRKFGYSIQSGEELIKKAVDEGLQQEGRIGIQTLLKLFQRCEKGDINWD